MQKKNKQMMTWDHVLCMMHPFAEINDGRIYELMSTDWDAMSLEEDEQTAELVTKRASFFLQQFVGKRLVPTFLSGIRIKPSLEPFLLFYSNLCLLSKGQDALFSTLTRRKSRFENLSMTALSLLSVSSDFSSYIDSLFGVDTQVDTSELVNISESMQKIGWTAFLRDVLVKAVDARIEKRVASTCGDSIGNYELYPICPSLEQWILSELQPWSQQILSTFRCDDLVEKGFTIYIKTVSSYVFEIICIDIEDSMSFLQDLKFALDRTKKHGFLRDRIRFSFKDRLLHPGASTDQLLTLFSLFVQVVIVLDKDGRHRLMSSADELKAYIKSRDDALSCLIRRAMANKFDPAAIDLSEGLSISMSSREDPMEWIPKTSPSKDLISEMLQLYNSPEPLAEEFRKQLGSRLLRRQGFDCDREREVLEHLSARIGSSGALHFASTMLDDLLFSKRFQKEHWINAKVLTKAVWPKLEKADLNLPLSVRDHLLMISQAYEKIKVPRELVWIPRLGQTVLEIKDPLGSCASILCSPLEASVFLGLCEHPIEHLPEHLCISKSDVQSALTFWLNKSIIHATETGYELNPTKDWNLMNSSESEDYFDDTGREEVEQQKSVVSQKIFGFLPSFRDKGLACSEIHNMLLLLSDQGSSSSESPYLLSEGQLRNLLSELVKDGKLEITQGLYKKAS